MCILTGPSASGKTSLVRSLAQLTGHTLHEFAMNSSVDTTEILGMRIIFFLPFSYVQYNKVDLSKWI